MRTVSAILLLMLTAAPAAMANQAVSLQFTVAAPDPVMAGDEVVFQTLVVNTGAAAWRGGNYYWVAEVYSMDGDERRFLAKTDTLTPSEDVPAGGAAGARLPFTVPDNLKNTRLLYRVFLILDGRRILETDYRGFAVIEKEFRPPPPEDFKIGGDVTFSYRNSSSDGWDNHQGITSANVVGKVKSSSFLFNSYIVHTRRRPVDPTILLLNFYAPWGTLGVGDISPSLTPLSMEGQGMRGVSFERQRERLSLTALVGRTVEADDPDGVSSGRFARYSGGGKVSYEVTDTLKLTADAVVTRDDEYSISLATSATLTPQENMVYGGAAAWNFAEGFTYTGEMQFASYKPDAGSATGATSGSAMRNEVRYRGSLLSARAAFSQIAAGFASLSSPAVIPDRQNQDAELTVYASDRLTLSGSYNSYTDNLEDDPAKTKTTQTQTGLSGALKLFRATLVNLSLMNNSSLGEPSTVQDNQTTTMNLTVSQPVSAHTLNFGMQTSEFTDNTGLSHDLSSSLLSLSGAFRVSSRLSASGGFVNSSSEDKVDSSKTDNTSITANFTYSLPARGLAFQIWGTMTSGESDSPTAPSETSTVALNLETIWLKSKESKFVFGLGVSSRTDKINPANDLSQLSVLTRYNYSF